MIKKILILISSLIILVLIIIILPVTNKKTPKVNITESHEWFSEPMTGVSSYLTKSVFLDSSTSNSFTYHALENVRIDSYTLKQSLNYKGSEAKINLSSADSIFYKIEYIFQNDEQSIENAYDLVQDIIKEFDKNYESIGDYSNNNSLLNISKDEFKNLKPNDNVNSGKLSADWIYTKKNWTTGENVDIMLLAPILTDTNDPPSDTRMILRLGLNKTVNNIYVTVQVWAEDEPKSADI